MELKFSSGRKTCLRFLCVSEPNWSCMDNFDDHCDAKSCTTTAHLWCNLDSRSSLRPLWSAVIISPNLSAVQTLFTRSSGFSSAWRTRYFRAFAFFASRLFGKGLNNVCTASDFSGIKVLLKNVRMEQMQEVVWPRPLERRLSNLKISSLILPWNGCGHPGNSVPICSSWSPTARVCFRSHRARSGDRLLARLGQPKGSGCQL